MNYTSTMQTKTNGRSLPKGWQWARLGDVCDVVNGYGFPEHLQGRIDLPYPLIKVSDMNREGAEIFVKTASHTIDETILKTIGGKVFPPGTVIFPKVGGALLTNKKRILGVQATFDNNVMGVIPKNVLSEWLYYWLLTIDLKTLSNVQALPSIKQSVVADLQIPLPPLDEQRRIASRLNEQLAAVESARKAAKEQLYAAWQLPSSYLQELFGDTAKHKWNWQKLGEVCELLPSHTIKSIGDTVVTAITTASLSENGFLTAGLKTSRMDAKDAKQALVREGEILIARSNTPDLVGRVSIYPGNPPNVVASDLTIRIWAGSACHPPFLTAYLSYLYLSGYWKKMAGGTSGSMKKITRTQVLEVKIPVPDIETQKKTVAEMQSKMDNFRQLTQLLEFQLAEINRLPASLLQEAFAGGL